MHRSASRLTRVLACAAVPVVLAVAGCSSDSGKDSDSGNGKKSDSSASAKPSGKASAALEKATYATLPDPCKALQTATIDSLVPEAKDKNGAAAKSNDLANRSGCAWNGLDEDGLKGSQYRWLQASFWRYDSQAALGSADKRAEENYNKQVELAKTTQGAENVKAEPAEGIGNQGTSVVYSVKKDNVDHFNTTIVARTHNVVITLDYNGAGLEGAAAPDQAKLLQDAMVAAKEIVASVEAANQQQAQQPQSESPQPQ
ncbi:DUF3558 family protein [Streptomyces sp. NBC_01351]|uniref:DUF3558 family protein n=1 Tax=Streptomyces sp. NBC_01351 TaxID=2903833 RepID=UPI002E30368E|nr:DUF3558 family protein [Streptomyces sp. NBC_01351]